MSALLVAAPPRAAARRIDLATTPGQLRGFLGGCWLAAALLFFVSSGVVAQLGGTVRTIGSDSAPSVVAASEIYAALADLDASAADDLVAGPGGAPLARQRYEARRTLIAGRLLEAAGNITYGDEERAPLRVLGEGLPLYYDLIEQARVLNQLGRSREGGTLATFARATALLHETLLPAADRLRAVNQRQLDASYTAHRRDVTRDAIGLALVGVGLLALLIGAQLYLARRMRRLLSVPLAAATVLLAVYLGALLVAVRADEAQLRTAKVDAFDSVAALWGARALAYDLAAQERLALLYPAYLPGDAARAEGRVDERALLLAGRPITPDDVAAVAAGRPIDLPGRFGVAANNATFPGEPARLAALLRSYAAFLAVDGEVRALQHAGRHDEAVARAVGVGAGGGNAAFEQFDADLGAALALNETAFTDAIDRAGGALAPFVPATPLVALALAVLAWLGIGPRLREYTS